MPGGVVLADDSTDLAAIDFRCWLTLDSVSRRHYVCEDVLCEIQQLESRHRPLGGATVR